MRVCHCVNGPGQFGCSACGAPGWNAPPAPPPQYVYPPNVVYVYPPTEDRIREIIREELNRDDGEKLPGDE